ncbi:MAG: hypothetical protein AAFV07_09580 [Bacteroidota bacterium]
MIKRLKAILELIRSGASRERQRVIIAISFMMAVILWVLVTLNRDYPTEYRYPVVLKDVPEDILLTEQAAHEFVLEVHGVGVDLMVEHMRLRRDTVKLPFLNDLRKGEAVNTMDYAASFKPLLPPGATLTRIRPGRFGIEFSEKVSKRVPLVLNTEIPLKPAYQPAQPPVLSDDSVTLIGTEERLDEIDLWYTAPGKTEMVTEATSLSIPVMDTMEGIAVKPKLVSVSVEPRWYTETTLQVAVQVQDVPPNTEVRLSHEVIEVVCLVPMADYERILDESKNYKAFIPYSSLNPQQPFVIPRLNFASPIRVISRHPFELQFVLVRKVST